MQYAQLKQLVEFHSAGDASKTVVMSFPFFHALMRAVLINTKVFDETFYLRVYDDVNKAIKSGVISSALDHYVTTGYYEDRLPCYISVDEHYYLQNNPDVAEAIRRGATKNAQSHFEQVGYKEGRSPYSGFSIF